MAEMTAREMRSMGGKARLIKIPKEIRSQISKKGGDSTKQRYGMDHYRELGLKSAELRKKRKIEANITT